MFIQHSVTQKSLIISASVLAVIEAIDVHNNDPEAIQEPSESHRITLYFVGGGKRGVSGVMAKCSGIRIITVSKAG